MPTKTTDVWRRSYSERADLDWAFTEEGTNVWGLTSHGYRGYNGRYQGFGMEGVTTFADPRYIGVAIREGLMSVEGGHDTSSMFIFKDIGPGQGATIQSAVFTLPGACADPNNWCWDGSSYGLAIPESERFFKFKVYGVLEPDYLPRYLGEYPRYGYVLSSKAEFFPHFMHPRHYRTDSYPWMQRHTTAVVRWSVPAVAMMLQSPFVVPDLAPIIQEIVNLPKFRPDSRICFRLGFDGMYSQFNVPLGADLSGGGSMSAGLAVFAKPTLSVTYT